MDDPQKILIIRFSSIGDIVLATPLIRVLRRRYPHARIDFVIHREYAALLRDNPYITNIIEYEKSSGIKGLTGLKKRIRYECYDYILDIHRSIRSRYLTFLSGAKNMRSVNKRLAARFALVKFKMHLYPDMVSVSDRYIETVSKEGIVNDGRGLDLFIPEALTAQVQKKIALGVNRCIIGFCPSAKHATKRWLPERFIETGIALHDKYKAAVLVVGSKEDARLCESIAEAINAKTETTNAISLAGSLSLLESGSALGLCDCVVSNDSGLMHIAAAMKRNVVALFGSTVREFGFFPVGEKNIVIENMNLSCRPCSHIGKEHCPKKHFRCMKEITTGEVMAACTALLKK